MDGYEQYVNISNADLLETQNDLAKCQEQMQKEERIVNSLRVQRDLNKTELDRIAAEYAQLESELKSLTNAFNAKQQELDNLRIQAGHDAQRMAIERCEAQATTNVLILEVKKYEGLHRFMDLERDLIMRAQKDAAGLNPALSAQDAEAAEEHQRELE